MSFLLPKFHFSPVGSKPVAGVVTPNFVLSKTRVAQKRYLMEIFHNYLLSLYREVIGRLYDYEGDCFTEGTRDFFWCKNLPSKAREVLHQKKSSGPEVKQSHL